MPINRIEPRPASQNERLLSFFQKQYMNKNTKIKTFSFRNGIKVKFTDYFFKGIKIETKVSVTKPSGKVLSWITSKRPSKTTAKYYAENM